MERIAKNSWHLAQNEKEAEITEFEMQLWRVFNGFMRWVDECERSANNSNLTCAELSILHVIRMKGRPKSAVDIGKLLNRTDNYNISYTIRKLIKMGLIKKIEVSPNNAKTTQYEITEKGVEGTNNYRGVRYNILIDKIPDNQGFSLSEITKNILQLKTIYEEAEQSAAFYDHDVSTNKKN